MLSTRGSRANVSCRVDSPLHRRTWCTHAAWVFSLCLQAVPLLPRATAAAQENRPNVLLIVADDLNTALGCYGDPRARTPNLDRLAARGTRFANAHAQYPLCGPSRVSFLTGRRPEATGVYVLNTPARKALPDAVQLPQLFQQHGYHTVGAGKIAHSPQTNDPQAWDRYTDDASRDPEELAALQQRYGGGDGRPRAHVLGSDGRLTRDGLNATIIREAIAKRRGNPAPFFYALGFHKPHLPWTAPRRFFDLHEPTDFSRSEEPALVSVPDIALQTELSGFGQPEDFAAAVRGYYACISFIDHELGLILDELERQNLIDNTLIVFFSDHGFHLGDHGGLWAKLSAFRQATRVPLIVAGPGIPAGRTVDAPVELIDIFPTLAHLAGLPPPRPLDGCNLQPLWMSAPIPERFAFSLVYHYDVVSGRDIPGRTVIGSQWRYTQWEQGQRGHELYWHVDDPGEYRNRAHDPRLATQQTLAQRHLRQLPEPRPGPANRPRGLLRPGESQN